jgi:two-component system CheB/CheR fusion protein
VAPAKVSHATPATDDAPSGENLFSESPEQLRQLFTLLRTRTGVDFSLYKPGTLNRRIMRRMVLKRVDRIEDYLPLLQEQADELDGLFNDLLISVTGFFRDPKTFELLRRRLLPKLLKKRTGDTPLRIWSCGCSTGEEAYSIAITVVEAMQKLGKHVPVQIFASDLNERGIEKARAGVYPENILLDVSQERLRRFFVKVDGKYQVAKHIRDMCVFARQNVATDPPFSNLDLISCRNVLIYLTPVLQRRIFPIFHYALRNGGYLMLGNSEGIGEHSELFELADRKNKLFVKKLAAYRPTIDFERRPAGATPKEPKPIEPGTMTARIEVDGSNLQQKVDRLLLSRFTPAGVVINSQMDTLQFRGKTAAYLEHHSGTASLNLLKMVHEDLALDLRRAVRKAIQTGEKVEHSCGRLRLSGATRTVRIEVYPFQAGSSAASERYYLVLFQDVAAPETRAKEGPQEPSRKIDARQIARLQDDLASTKESLQTIIEEQDATNEELKSANEEVQSSNEELQSTNEELETAREELQSTNEELSTLNQELQNRNNELGQLNNDLTNLLSSVHIAIIMMGTDLRIRRFTPMAEKIFNLIPSDVGRRLSDLNRNVNIPDLDEMIQQVIDHLNVVEREVQDREGHWYSLRIRPYRTQESMIDGVVLMLFDIDELKRSIRHIVGLIRHPVILLHGDMRVNRANEAFCEMFAVSPAEIEEKPFYEIAEKRWNFKAMRELLEEVLPRQGEVLNYRLTHDFPGLGRKKLLLNARRFYEESRGVQLFLLSLVEIKD